MPACGQDAGPPGWFGDISLYPYQRMVEDDADLTITLNGRLPGRLSYFSYSNFAGLLSGSPTAFDRSEQNLRYAMSERLPFDANLQLILMRGDGNDFTQLGLGWRVNDTPGWRDFFDRINLTYRLTVQLYRYGTNEPGGWALEHFFRLTAPNVSDRLYLSGFVDQGFSEDLPPWMPRRPMVAEVQFGARVWKDFYAVAEYRINERRMIDHYNFVVGMEYKFRW